MSKTFTPKGSNRASFTHQDQRLRAQNPLYNKTTPVAGEFERERCPLNAKVMDDAGLTEAQRRHKAMGLSQSDASKRAVRRESFMIKRSRPDHILRPPLSMAFGPDRQAFNACADRDHRNALQDQSPEDAGMRTTDEFRKACRSTFIRKRAEARGQTGILRKKNHGRGDHSD